MKKILAFAGSTSSTSINKQLITYSASLVKYAEVEIFDLNEYQAEIFDVDKEKEGFPDNLVQLSKK